MDKKLMIIDTDCGVDDALAILLALSCKDEWHIKAITCCNGNTTVDKVCGNVMRLTNYTNRREIPIYSGNPKSLLNVFVPTSKEIHGNDGFGGVSSSYATGNQNIEEDSAAIALVNYAQKYKGSITLVALGPLTNVALAKRLDDNFDKNLKQMLIMGGNIDGIGNTTTSAEFNFGSDPEAAFIVINEFSCPMKIFPWETRFRSALSWDFYEKWTSTNHPISLMIQKITCHTVTHFKTNVPGFGYHPPDLLAMATLLKPSSVQKVVASCPVTVELAGNNTRGLMVVDRRLANKRGTPSGNIEIITELNINEVAELLMSMV